MRIIASTRPYYNPDTVSHVHLVHGPTVLHVGCSSYDAYATSLSLAYIDSEPTSGPPGTYHKHTLQQS